MSLSLSDFPEFQELAQRLQQVEGELQQLREWRRRAPKWVNAEQAQEITGLSRDTLRRLRQAPDTVLVYKEDHGVRYDYESLLRHNERRAIGRGRLAQLYPPTAA